MSYNHHKTLKERVEYDNYKLSALYGIVDAKPLMVTGPTTTRTMDIVTRLGIAGERLSTIVERDLDEFNRQKEIILKSPYASLEHIYGCIEDQESSIQIDADLTSSFINAGEDIRKTFKKQANAFPNQTKSFIFTMSMRGKSKKDTLKFIKYNLIYDILGDFCSYGLNEREPRTSIEFIKWKEEAKGIWPAYNKIPVHLLIKKRILDIRLISYNAGGGPMITCNIIYK